MADRPTILEISALQKFYASSGGPVEALRGVNLTVRKGEFVSGYPATDPSATPDTHLRTLHLSCRKRGDRAGGVLRSRGFD